MPAPLFEKPKDSFYFSHDSNARNDIKIIKLRRELGLEGYGIYWCIIEMLRDEADHRLPMESIKDIAFQIVTSEEKIQAVITRYDLFKIEKDYFLSERLSRSMLTYNNNKLQLSNAGKKGMANRWNKPDQQVPAAPKLRQL